MAFYDKFSFEKYLEESGLEMVTGYPGSYLDDQRNYRIGVLLNTNDLTEYYIEIDTDAGFPLAVIFDNNHKQTHIISLRQKQA